MTIQPRQVHGSDADAYLYRRVEAELRMAENATCAAAVKAHYELANLYLERLGADDGRSGQRVIGPPAHRIRSG